MVDELHVRLFNNILFSGMVVYMIKRYINNRTVNNSRSIEKVDLLITIAITIVSLCLFSSVLVAKGNASLPITISSANGLDAIRNNLSGRYVVSKDIDMSKYVDEYGNKKGWVPIGTKDNPFTGTIDFNYHSLCNLSFSSGYIDDQFKKENVNELAIGFLGYSNGILIHANFYEPIFPKITSLSSVDKEVIYGTACAINYGYVTSCSVLAKGNSGVFEADNLVFGTLVGVNEKQLLNNSCLNTINIRCGKTGVIGGVVGKTKKGSINSYLVRRGYTTIYCDSDVVVSAGGVSGQDEGGNFDNVYHGPARTNQRENFAIKSQTGGNGKIVAGGLIGSINGTGSTSINNGYCYSVISMGFADGFLFAGGLVGSNYSSLSLSSCVSQTYYNSSNSEFSGFGVVIGHNTGQVNSNVVYYIPNSSITDDCNIEFGNIIEFESLTLQMLGWPNDVSRGRWSKTESIFLLSL